MHVLVTGGAGFIGSHVVDRLMADGHYVTVLDNLSSGSAVNLNRKVHLVRGDVADVALVTLLAQEADAIVHLAAISAVQVCEQEPERAARTNMQGTETIFAAAERQNIPVVYASSAAVYGDNPNLPLAEGEQAAPLGNYGRHKRANEQAAPANSVGLRFFNVYGPRQDPRSPYSGVISIFNARAKAGETLTFFGDGEQTRDFIYVGDVVELIMRALTHRGAAMVVNGCTGAAVSLKQLAEVIGQVMGKNVTTAYQPARNNDIRHSLGDPSFASKQLQFTAKTPLQDGLKRLIMHG